MTDNQYRTTWVAIGRIFEGHPVECDHLRSVLAAQYVITHDGALPPQPTFGLPLLVRLRARIGLGWGRRFLVLP
jgi:hypothetical protein